MTRRALAILMLCGAGIAGGCWILSPPARQTLEPPPGSSTAVRGAIHVHTARSDGSGTVEDVAAEAARAGLTFVIFTDHGDATREPDAPAYRSGVLSIDAVEISTDGGHVVALGLPRAPYPLGGEPRDVVEDIARLGAMSIAAHPGSTRPDLQWVEWTAPVDGLEWLNGDSEWRDEAPGTLARALLTYPFRRAETVAALLDRPEPVLARWDGLTGSRRVVAVAGADAHARLSLPGSPEPRSAAPLLRIPSYEQMFRAFSIALPDIVLTGDANADARAVLDGIRRGRVYSSIDALAGPAAFAFTASAGAGRAGMGDTIDAGPPVTFRVETNAPANARITLLKNGDPVAAADGASLQQVENGGPGVYRVEVHLPEAPGDPPVPWILSNPIYVRAAGSEEAPRDPRGVATEFAAVYQDGSADGVTVESSVRSRGALDVVPTVGGTQLSLRYALGGTRSESPYAALVLPAGPGLAQYDRLMFTAHAMQPMRLSVQLRVPEGPEGERWHRSVYLDEIPREITIAFDEMTPRGPTTRRQPVLAAVRDVLFVIDTVNTSPGTSGQVWIDEVRYAR